MNKVILLGNLTRDPELKQLDGGNCVCNMGVAVNRTYISNGEKQEEVLFIDLTAWGKLAENCNTYLLKGRKILIEGRLKLDTWENEAGESRRKIHVVAEKIEFLSKGNDQKDDPGEAQPF